MIKEMKSHDLQRISRVKNKGKKVMLINPKKEGIFFSVPHNGLAILATILKKRGHEVLVVDYLFMRGEQKELSFFIKEFNPDVVGVSMYTTSVGETNKIIEKVRSILPDVPLIVGGPHATMYADLLEKDSKIDYIVSGEAELIITSIVENAKREKKAKIIKAKEILNLENVPIPDFRMFYRWQEIRGYPIMTSRGCPNQCVFCPVLNLAFKKWRARKPAECIEEIKFAKKTLSHNISTYVMDDNPTVDRKRFKEFLRLYAEEIMLPLVIINTRADAIDEEMVVLMKRAGCDTLFLGVEHANPEMFKSVNKGETLEQIEKAARLVKKHGLILGLSFIIGLPGDNLEKTIDSIKFSQKLNAEWNSVSFITPYRNTKIKEYFDSKKISYNEVDSNPQLDSDFECNEPIIGTEDFTKEERKKAYYMFMLRTSHPRLQVAKLRRIALIAFKYRLYWDFFYWLPRGIIKDFHRYKILLKTAFRIFRKEGIKKLIERYKNRNK